MTTSLAQGVGAGGGGDVIDLRTYYDRALSETDLNELLENNGLKLKEGLIIPMIRYVSPSMIENQTAQSNFTLITKDRVKLERDIIYSIFEFGTCVSGHDACVEKSEPFSTLIFDKKSLLAKHTSLGDLGGLVIHEYEHKYGNPDHTFYALPKYFKERIEAKKHIGQVYSINENDIKSKLALSVWKDFFKNPRVFIAPKDEVQEKADFYCKKRGFFSALSYQTLSLESTVRYLSAFDFFVVKVNGYGDFNVLKSSGFWRDYSSGWCEISQVTCGYR